jgi:hypothetical protein
VEKKRTEMLVEVRMVNEKLSKMRMMGFDAKIAEDFARE